MVGYVSGYEQLVTLTIMTADSESGADDLDDHLKKAFITMTLDMKATRAAQQHNNICLFLVVRHDEDMGTLRWLLCDTPSKF